MVLFSVGLCRVRVRKEGRMQQTLLGVRPEQGLWIGAGGGWVQQWRTDRVLLDW
jgi:hypothetical protein